jgi:hypothetical protein
MDFSKITSFIFKQFRLNDSLSDEKKNKFYQPTDYKDDISSQQLSYPQEVNKLFHIFYSRKIFFYFLVY